MLGREERRATTSPAHLLREERTGRVGADTGGQAERDVLDLPAAINSAEASVDVLGEANLGSTTDFNQSSASVHGVTADTD